MIWFQLTCMDLVHTKRAGTHCVQHVLPWAEAHIVKADVVILSIETAQGKLVVALEVVTAYA